MICNYIYSDLHFLVANGPYNYCREVWLTLGVSLLKLLWKFLMLVLGMDYLDWFVKKEKYIGTLFLMLWMSRPKPKSVQSIRKISQRYTLFLMLWMSRPKPKSVQSIRKISQRYLYIFPFWKFIANNSCQVPTSRIIIIISLTILLK